MISSRPYDYQPNRWVIATAGVVMQIALGAVYAWSVFRIPLTQSFGWTIPQVTLAFTAGMVGIISIANGAGRFLWAWCRTASAADGCFF